MYTYVNTIFSSRSMVVLLPKIPNNGTKVKKYLGKIHRVLGMKLRSNWRNLEEICIVLGVKPNVACFSIV